MAALDISIAMDQGTGGEIAHKDSEYVKEVASQNRVNKTKRSVMIEEDFVLRPLGGIGVIRFQHFPNSPKCRNYVLDVHTIDCKDGNRL